MCSIKLLNSWNIMMCNCFNWRETKWYSSMKINCIKLNQIIISLLFNFMGKLLIVKIKIKNNQIKSKVNHNSKQQTKLKRSSHSSLAFWYSIQNLFKSIYSLNNHILKSIIRYSHQDYLNHNFSYWQKIKQSYQFMFNPIHSEILDIKYLSCLNPNRLFNYNMELLLTYLSIMFPMVKNS